MINPFEMLLGKARSNPAMQGLSQATEMAKAAQNPGGMMQGIGNMMLSNLPGYQQAMAYIQQHGGDARKAFEGLCEEARAMGVQNPESALDQAKGAMNNK